MSLRESWDGTEHPLGVFVGESWGRTPAEGPRRRRSLYLSRMHPR
ncbi:hypothetical protein FM125_08260 [Micrococcus lylae]|uniref:Uncharacterized protein n=1 Tax=Micrococcus lylae TaxID=1273 RepID=A0A1R4JFJ9_9MICC|nr:hypothetical protein FM125_08260 [Micrococcus lylae]